MARTFKIDAPNKQGYKWVCVADGPPDPVTGKRQQIKRRADKKTDAEERVQEAIRKLKEQEGDATTLKKQPFDKIAAEWLETYSKSKKRKSTIRIRSAEINCLNNYIAKTHVEKLTHKAYQQILNDLHDKNSARNTIRGVHVTANMIFKYVLKHNIRKDNPCTGAIIPEKKLTVEEIENTDLDDKYLEKSELTEFLRVASENGLSQDKEIFYLLAFSGMRSGELCALKWSDINFATNEVRITKTLHNPDNKTMEYELGPPKTMGSIRTIDIDESVIELLKSYQVKQSKLKLDHNFHNENFVFRLSNGYPLNNFKIRRRMKRIIKKTLITKHATPHIFRHTHISMLAEAEVDLKTIMRRVGHDEPQTTMKIYTHVTEKMKKNAGNKIKIHFADIIGAISLQ
ncbi:Tyrosine recombinase XerC [compost metagenome]